MQAWMCSWRGSGQQQQVRLGSLEAPQLCRDQDFAELLPALQMLLSSSRVEGASIHASQYASASIRTAPSRTSAYSCQVGLRELSRLSAALAADTILHARPKSRSEQPASSLLRGILWQGPARGEYHTLRFDLLYYRSGSQKRDYQWQGTLNLCTAALQVIDKEYRSAKVLRAEHLLTSLCLGDHELPGAIAPLVSTEPLSLTAHLDKVHAAASLSVPSSCLDRIGLLVWLWRQGAELAVNMSSAAARAKQQDHCKLRLHANAGWWR